MSWLMLLLGIIVLIIAYLWGEPNTLVIFLPISGLIGWLIDDLGIRRLGFWEYTRFPYPSFRYFLILPVCWGIFGMTINFIWLTIGNNRWWAIIAVYAILLGSHEGLNQFTKSWRYKKVSLWIVVIGWFPLILFYRAVFYLIWRI